MSVSAFLSRPRTLSLLLALAPSACAHERGNEMRIASAERLSSQLTQLQEPPTVRRVRVHKDNYIDPWGSRPSPDGRYLLATNWASGDLVAIDLVNDTTASLTGRQGWTDDEFAYGGTWAADGQSVVYAWFRGADTVALRTMPVSGADSGKSRLVYQSDDLTYISPQAATPNGREIIGVVQRRDFTSSIVAFALAGGAMRVLKSLDWRYPLNLAVSPDGRWLAYDFPPSVQSAKRDVYLLNLTGNQETAIVRGSSSHFVAGWSADGQYLLYGSQERGSPASIWALPLRDGKAAGAAVLVRNDMWRMFPLGSAANGRIVYTVETGRRDVFTVNLDAREGKATSAPISASGEAPDALPWQIAFSPDGEHVAYTASRGAGLGAGPYDIVIRPLAGGPERRISPRLTQLGRMTWLRDGSLALASTDEQRKRVLAKIDLQTGQMTTSDTPLSGNTQTALSSDGSVLYFTSMAPGNRAMHLHRFQVASRQQDTLHTFENQTWPAGMTLSPDERYIALLTRARGQRPAIDPASAAIELVPIGGGTVRTLYTFPDGKVPSPIHGIDWSSDGRYLYFVMPQNEPESEIWRIDVADGNAAPVGVQARSITRVRVSPDGRRLGFGLSNFESEIWVMEPPQLPAADRRLGAVR